MKKLLASLALGLSLLTSGAVMAQAPPLPLLLLHPPLPKRLTLLRLLLPHRPHRP